MAAPRHVGHAHAEHERVHQVADHDVAAVHGLVLGEPHVGVQRVVVHRDHAEQVIVVLGDRLAGPVTVDVTGLEVLEVAAEGAVVDGHRFLRSGGRGDGSGRRSGRPTIDLPTPCEVSPPGVRSHGSAR